MKKYLVKVVNVATDANVNFRGVTEISYYGKNEKRVDFNGELNKYLVSGYGYSRECDARRSWIFKNEYDDPEFWTTFKSIVAVDIVDGEVHVLTK